MTDWSPKKLTDFIGAQFIVLVWFLTWQVLKVGFAVNYKDAQKLIRTGIAVTQGSVVDVRERCASSMGLAWGAEQSLSLRRAAGALLNCELLKDGKRKGGCHLFAVVEQLLQHGDPTCLIAF